MVDIRKERLILVVTTLAAIACIMQIYFGQWEFWVAPVLLVGGIIIWWLHFSQKADFRTRTSIYFVYGAFLVFFTSIHNTSLFDISVMVMLIMAVYTMLDRVALLNLIIAEYAVVMIILLVNLYLVDELDVSGFNLMKILLHTGSVAVLYLFCRTTVNRRIAERERIEEWRTTVAENDHDMEDFLANISHELRTPVNVINGMSSILQKESDREELAAIKGAGIRLSHQIEDIQDYTELKRGELILENEKYMCISLINDIVAFFNAHEKRHDLELIVDLAPDTPTLLEGDIKKLHKIFRHLLENAMKFTRRGGVYVRVYTVPQEYGVNLIIEITDTGIGMTRADMAKVSKGMYQANKKRNRSTGGIGIGLPIVYGFVHKMGGFVKINSKKRSGTTIRLTIPQKVVDTAPCLSVDQKIEGDLVFYIKQEKYQVPEVRDFYRSMALNLATGVRVKLYAAGDKRELEHLISDLSIGYIFTGQEEYEEEAAWLDYLSSQGMKVIVSANPGFESTAGSGILVLPKPLYGFPVVRILNGEYTAEDFGKNEKGKLTFNGVRALVVDDEPMNLVVATGLFKEYGIVTDTAEGGREALKKYDSGDYEVIFMDHMMPGMDGVETMKHIREIADGTDRKPIIIALTANALSGAREMFMREGFDGFIAKPIDIGEFERVMKNLLPDELVQYEGRDAS